MFNTYYDTTVIVLILFTFSDVRTGNHGEMGWQPGEDTIPPYSVSKLGVITATKVLAENLKDGPRDGILINTVSPHRVMYL